MSKRILLIQGHPDTSAPHFCNALATSYCDGAQGAGHTVRKCRVAMLNFPLLRSQQEFETGLLPLSLQTAQDDILWCEHIVLFFPLWAGGMPALLKGFLEQVFRPAFTGASVDHFGKKLLTGRSARVVVTMGMPALVYRLYFRAHSVKSLERSLLGIVGIGPVQETLIGMTTNIEERDATRWLVKLKHLGERGE